ncbi:hypothetical protein AMTRI_Chr02g262650 [Amborella trichopoda]
MGTAKYLEKKNHPYDEESPRATYSHNFYHALEDMVAAKLLETQVSWSIHRPRLLMGCSTSSFFNIFGCLSCFVGLVVRQQIWAAINGGDAIKGHALNAINGQNLTWKEHEKCYKV